MIGFEYFDISSWMNEGLIIKLVHTARRVREGGVRKPLSVSLSSAVLSVGITMGGICDNFAEARSNVLVTPQAVAKDSVRAFNSEVPAGYWEGLSLAYDRAKVIPTDSTVDLPAMM